MSESDGAKKESPVKKEKGKSRRWFLQAMGLGLGAAVGYVTRPRSSAPAEGDKTPKPVATATETPATQPKTEAAVNHERYPNNPGVFIGLHVAVEGDTFSGIADKYRAKANLLGYKLETDDIVDANEYEVPEPELLQPGQIVTVVCHELDEELMDDPNAEVWRKKIEERNLDQEAPPVLTWHLVQDNDTLYKLADAERSPEFQQMADKVLNGREITVQSIQQANKGLGTIRGEDGINIGEIIAIG